MYSVSEKFKDAIKNSNPSYLTGTITFKDGSSREISTSDIALGGASITMQAVTQDILEFGAAVLGQLDISIRTDKSESRYKYYDAVINLLFTIDLGDGTQESIPLGIWTIVEAEREGVALKMSAYDNLVKFDKDYSLTLTGTPFELMSVIAEDCECELAEGIDYYKALPNGEEIISIMTGSSCSSYRQAASIIAQMCGAFVQADRNGKISLKLFQTTETFSLATSQRYNSRMADYICDYVALNVTGLAGTFKSVIDEEATGLVMSIDDAPAWDTGLNEVLQQRTDNLRAYLDTIQYTPGEVSIPGDPSIDCGDYVTLLTTDISISTLVTSYTWNFHDQMELQSVGKNPYLTGTSASKQRILRTIEQSGGVGGGAPPMLYTFKNVRNFKCNASLQAIAKVTFVASKDTFAIFDATMQIDVEIDDVEKKSSLKIIDSNGSSKTYEVPYTQPGTVDLTIQYYFNTGYIENPYTLTLGKGSHIITLHYPFSNVEKDSINRFEVHMSCNGGKVSIQKEMFYGTITGSGLAGTPKWDGTLTFDETIGMIPINLGVANFSDQLNISKQVPTISGFNEVISPISISLGVVGVNEVLSVGHHTEFYIFSTEKASLYEFDRANISSDGAFTLIDASVGQTIVSDKINLNEMSIIGIEKASVDCDGDVLIAVSFDNKSTWVAFNGGQWVTLSSDLSGMSKESMESITVDKWEEIRGTATDMYLRVALTNTEQAVHQIKIDFINS